MNTKKPVLNSIDSVGIVVKDIKTTAGNFMEFFGIGPFAVYEYGSENIEDLKVHKERSGCRYLMAKCRLNDCTIELIQPLDSKSIFSEFLENRGENLFHIGYKAGDYDEALDFFKARGIDVAMSGNHHGGCRFSFLDSQKELKHIVYLSDPEPGFLGFKTGDNGIGIPVSPIPHYTYPENTGSPKRKPVFARIGQVAFMVDSVDEMVEMYERDFGLETFKVWEFSPDTVEDMTVGGIKQGYTMRLGKTRVGDMDFEFIQPRDDKSIYYDYMKIYGEGFHHLAYELEEYDKQMEYIGSIGVKVSMSGVWFGKHTWVYLTTEELLKHIVELNYTREDFVEPESIRWSAEL